MDVQLEGEDLIDPRQQRRRTLARSHARPLPRPGLVATLKAEQAMPMATLLTAAATASWHRVRRRPARRSRRWRSSQRQRSPVAAP